MKSLSICNKKNKLKIICSKRKYGGNHADSTSVSMITALIMERVEMKIQTSREIRIVHQEDGKLLVLHTDPNGVDTTSILDKNVFAIQSGEPKIYLTPIKNGAMISRSDGGILSFRESENGLMIASDLVKLVDFKKSNYLKFTLDSGEE